MLPGDRPWHSCETQLTATKFCCCFEKNITHNRIEEKIQVFKSRTSSTSYFCNGIWARWSSRESTQKTCQRQKWRSNHHLTGLHQAIICLRPKAALFEVRSHHRHRCFISKCSVTKLSWNFFDLETKSRPKWASFLPANVVHGEKTTTHDLGNCVAGHNSGTQNLRMNNSATAKKKT
jgi:hypothetical protein